MPGQDRTSRMGGSREVGTIRPTPRPRRNYPNPFFLAKADNKLFLWLTFQVGDYIGDY